MTADPPASGPIDDDLDAMIEDPTWSPPEETREWVSGICGICPANCGVKIERLDGRIGRVVPDKEAPMGFICKLGVASSEIVHGESRLRYPMKRVGPKGSLEFTRISWDEAFDMIVERFEAFKAESGPESVAIYTGRGSFERSMCDLLQPREAAISSASSILFPFGSPNTLGVGALCYVSFAMIAPHVTMGRYLHDTYFDIDNAGLVLVWGANPATDSPPADLIRIRRAQAKGAEVIVIDPRRSETVRKTGAEWIPIRPGTDGALALGLCEVLIQEELYDAEFVSEWVHGWDEFIQYTQHFHPEAVELITGVPAGKIRQLARKLATANGAAPLMYTGLEYSNSGVQAIRAVMTLFAIAGQLDVPGGYGFQMDANRFPIPRDHLLSNPDIKKSLGRDRFPLYSHYRGESHAIALPESVLEGRPYRIRGLIVLGASITTSWPETPIWQETLEKLEFLVTIDRQLSADAAYADLVLPATTGYEITSYTTYGPVFRIREKIIEPVGEARNDFLILTELATRLGYGDLFPQSEDEILKLALKDSDFTLEQVREAGGMVRVNPVMQQYKKWEKGLLRPDGKPGFDTPTGRFEIASTILAEHGYDALPVYTEPTEGPVASPDLAKRFPLIFNSGSRVPTDFRSQHHGVPSLLQAMPEPLVSLNAEDALERGIATGDLVQVVTARGAVDYRAYVTKNIVSGAIDAHMGGGGPTGPSSWQACNVNVLTDLGNHDPISGFPVYKALLCEVVKLADSDGTVVPAAERAEAEERFNAMEMAAPRKRIYLDHNATTPVAEEVLAAMIPHFRTAFGNPSSVHGQGLAAKIAIEGARRQVALLLNCTARRIVFTGGGSAGDNLAIKGTAFARQSEGKHIITSTIEHDAVINTCRWLETQGFEVSYLDVGSDGRVDPVALQAAVRPNETILVSLMSANNELGTLNPLAELIAIAHAAGAWFHSDAVQTMGKMPVDVQELDIDLLSFSGHKIYGPKGVGALYVRKGIAITPLVHGGHQEGGLRAGTENVASIVGLGAACDLALRRIGEYERIKGLRDHLEQGILEVVPSARLNGHRDERNPNTLNMVLPDLRGESLVYALDNRGIAISSGSACRAGQAEPSHVLMGIGLSEEDGHCSVRFSLGLDTTQEDIDATVEALRGIIAEIGATVQFIACR